MGNSRLLRENASISRRASSHFSLADFFFFSVRDCIHICTIWFCFELPLCEWNKFSIIFEIEIFPPLNWIKNSHSQIGLVNSSVNICAAIPRNIFATITDGKTLRLVQSFIAQLPPRAFALLFARPFPSIFYGCRGNSLAKSSILFRCSKHRSQPRDVVYFSFDRNDFSHHPHNWIFYSCASLVARWCYSTVDTAVSRFRAFFFFGWWWVFPIFNHILLNSVPAR